jgi:hypothetical protein
MDAKATTLMLLFALVGGSRAQLLTSADASRSSTTPSTLPFIYNDGPVGTYSSVLAAGFSFNVAASILDFNFTVNVPGFAVSLDTFNCTGIPYILFDGVITRVFVNATGNACLDRFVASTGGVVGNNLLSLNYAVDTNSVAFTVAGNIINLFNPDNSTVVTVPTGLYLQAVSSIWVFDPVKNLVSIDMNISLPNLPVNPLLFNCQNVPYYPDNLYSLVTINDPNNACIARISHSQQFSSGEPLPIQYDFKANVVAFAGFFDVINMRGDALPAPTTAGPTLALSSGPTGVYASAPTNEQRMRMTFDPTVGQMTLDITLGYTGRNYNQSSWNCTNLSYYVTTSNMGFNFTNNSCFSSMLQYYQSERDDGTDVLLMTYNSAADSVSLGGRLIAPAVVMNKVQGGRRLTPSNFAEEKSTTSFSFQTRATLAVVAVLVLAISCSY